MRKPDAPPTRHMPPEAERVTMAEAMARLGLTAAGVRHRLQNGSLLGRREGNACVEIYIRPEDLVRHESVVIPN